MLLSRASKQTLSIASTLFQDGYRCMRCYAIDTPWSMPGTFDASSPPCWLTWVNQELRVRTMCLLIVTFASFVASALLRLTCHLIDLC